MPSGSESDVVKLRHQSSYLNVPVRHFSAHHAHQQIAIARHFNLNKCAMARRKALRAMINNARIIISQSIIVSERKKTASTASKQPVIAHCVTIKHREIFERIVAYIAGEEAKRKMPIPSSNSETCGHQKLCHTL